MRIRTIAMWTVASICSVMVLSAPAAADDEATAAPPAASLPIGAAAHGEVAPTAGEPHPEGLFADVSYLYWRARRRDLDFAIIDTGAAVGPVGSIESMHWIPDSGVRAGIGYLMPDSNSDVRLEYTYFHSRDTRFLSAPPDGRLWATLAAPVGFTAVNSASGLSSVNYNVLDLEFGQRFQCSDCFSIRLCGGPRIASIDQGFDVTYDGLAGIPGLVANAAQVSNPILFDGCGLRFGAEADWRMPWNLSVFVHGYASMLVGDMKTQYVEFNNMSTTLLVNVVDRFYKVIPVAEMAFGVSYRLNNMRLSLAYELTNWFGLVDTPDFVDDVHAGKIKRRSSDLSLDGLVLQWAIEF